jgi:glycosyltransferase 2 family protein
MLAVLHMVTTILTPLRSRRLRSFALRAGGLLVAVAGIVLLTQSFDLNAVAEALGRAEPVWLVPVMVILVGQLGLRALRLRTLLPHPTDESEIGLGSLAGAMLVSNLANNVTPARVGDGVKCYLVSQNHRISFSTVLGTLVLEHGIDCAILAIIAAFVAIGLAASGPLYVVSVAAGIIGAGILVTLFVVRPAGLDARLRRGRPGRIARLVPPRARSALRVSISHFSHGFRAIRHRRILVAALAMAVLLWLSDGLLFWLVARSLGLVIDPAAAMFIAAGVALTAAFPGAPGNVGTHEYTVVAAAAAVGLAGSGVLALAFLVHALQLVPATLAGIAVMAVGGHRLTVPAGATSAGPAEPAGVPRHGALRWRSTRLASAFAALVRPLGHPAPVSPRPDR